YDSETLRCPRRPALRTRRRASPDLALNRLSHPRQRMNRLETTPLLVFADDWGRHPSSCQHLIRHLLDRRAVDWVNTIGTRRPRLDLATLRRAVGKVWDWLRPRRAASALPDNLRVHSPRMWPSFASGLARGLNRRLLRRQLGRL